MTPIMRVVLPIVGALIGWNLASPETRLFDLVVGAAVGFAIADLGILRARLDALAAQVARLTTEFRRPHAAPPAPIQRPEPAPEAQDLGDPHNAVIPASSRPLTTSGLPRQKFEEPEARIPSERPGPVPPFTQEGATELPIIGAIRSFLTGGNTLVRAGVIVLFFGVAFLLRYMAEHTTFPSNFA